jgi:cell division protein FtsB
MIASPATTTRAWIGVFAVWIILLSGVFGLMGETRFAPGALQAVRLNALLDSRKEQLSTLQAELDRMSSEANLLEHSRATQVREIRRTLGYAAPDEIIFDFSSPESVN